MTARGRRALWSLIAVGILARVALALTTFGQPFDVDSFYIVRAALTDHGLEFYGYVNEPSLGGFRWPYPPAFLPWLPISDRLAGLTGIDYHDLVQLPAIAADAAIAWLVQRFLAGRGVAERTRLLAVAAVMFGPAFVAISGYHTQIDSVAILPAVAAVVVWVERPEARRRWLWAGLLVGLAAALKTTPILVLLALVPSARSLREAAATAATACAVPGLALAPFFFVDPGDVLRLADYQGAPGAGGLTMVLDPSLLQFWLTDTYSDRPSPLDPNGLVQLIADGTGPITVAVFAAIGLFLARFRVDPVRGAMLIWLGLYAAGTAFFFQYLVWGLPFFLLAGRVREAIALQLAVLIPIVLLYAGPRDSAAAETAYYAIMTAVWLACAAAFVITARGVVRSR
jgi:hypothetical protein